MPPGRWPRGIGEPKCYNLEHVVLAGTTFSIPTALAATLLRATREARGTSATSQPVALDPLDLLV